MRFVIVLINEHDDDDDDDDDVLYKGVTLSYVHSLPVCYMY